MDFPAVEILSRAKRLAGSDEDLASDIYTSALSQWHSNPPLPGKLGTWLYQISMRRRQDQFRRAKPQADELDEQIPSRLQNLANVGNFITMFSWISPLGKNTIQPRRIACLMPPSEVALILRISARSLYTLEKEGKIKPVKIGRCKRFSSIDVLRLTKVGTA